jgi:hypothetical protein
MTDLTVCAGLGGEASEVETDGTRLKSDTGSGKGIGGATTGKENRCAAAGDAQNIPPSAWAATNIHPLIWVDATLDPRPVKMMPQAAALDIFIGRDGHAWRLCVARDFMETDASKAGCSLVARGEAGSSR